MIAKSRMLNESDTVLCATRYGNVMASRGSVDYSNPKINKLTLPEFKSGSRNLC